MKKRIIICVACIAVVGLSVHAQSDKTRQSKQSDHFIAPPPPPPVPPVPPLPPVIDENELPAPPPPPPLPPVPPVPPVPEIENEIATPEFSSVEIINSNGYEVSVRIQKGKEMVIIKKDGKEQQIKLSTWNANRKFYEKKFGLLPPPPPPIKREMSLTAPMIVKGYSVI